MMQCRVCAKEEDAPAGRIHLLKLLHAHAHAEQSHRGCLSQSWGGWHADASTTAVPDRHTLNQTPVIRLKLQHTNSSAHPFIYYGSHPEKICPHPSVHWVLNYNTIAAQVHATKATDLSKAARPDAGARSPIPARPLHSRGADRLKDQCEAAYVVCC